MPAAPAAAAAAPPPPLPLPPPPPPPPPPEEPAEELLLAAAPSAVGLVDLTEVPPAATPAAVADDPGAPAATGLLQPDPQSADEGDRAAADAAAAEAAAAADAGEAVSVGLGPARDHPSADESGTAGDADEGSVQLQPAVAMVDRVGAKHYRVLAVPHCSTKTDAPATQFRTREREPARQPSALRFCWDETHLQLASAVLSDGDIVGRGRQRCAGAMSEFDGGDVIRLSLSSGPDLPSRWIALSISAAGGLAIARVEAGGEVEKAFDCTGSGTHVAESRVISSVMLGKSCCCCTSDAIAIISCAVLAWLLSQLILLACSVVVAAFASQLRRKEGMKLTRVLSTAWMRTRLRSTPWMFPWKIGQTPRKVQRRRWGGESRQGYHGGCCRAAAGSLRARTTWQGALPW